MLDPNDMSLKIMSDSRRLGLATMSGLKCLNLTTILNNKNTPTCNLVFIETQG